MSRFNGASFAQRLLLPPQRDNSKSRQEGGLTEISGKRAINSMSSVFESQRNSSQDVGGNQSTIMPNSSMDSLQELKAMGENHYQSKPQMMHMQTTLLENTQQIIQSEEKKLNTDKSESDLTNKSMPNWANRRLSSKSAAN